ncbi:TIGR01621 family pseudouridine synthase [Pseudoalteromonas sp. T1lg76]|uniref:TIGR01621 family pseudouridine synthase n=1 Tax=Pseudoalteromonas sp. T1lg76 TaxID=2077103 RepID=UPI000CF657A4|nr:TIGR01621 family pseudouridine synthase [Pseudoalteromonas sp. T1lg76]
MSPLQLLAQERDFIVVNKPAGMNFHTEDDTPGLVALAAEQFGLQLFPVHRLDKVTSGLVLLPTSSEAAARFTTLFTERRVNKFYLALASDKPKKKQGWIKGDMVKARRGAFKLLKSQENPAITRFYSYSLAPKVRGFVLKPYSGKTHQLRVAMKSLSAPIIGDKLYGGQASDRTYLHAYALQFEYQQQNFQFSVPPSEGELSEYLSALTREFSEQPWQLEW